MRQIRFQKNTRMVDRATDVDLLQSGAIAFKGVQCEILKIKNVTDASTQTYQTTQYDLQTTQQSQMLEKTVEITEKTVTIVQKTIEFDEKTIEIDRNKVEIDRNKVEIDRNKVEIDKNYENQKNSGEIVDEDNVFSISDGKVEYRRVDFIIFLLFIQPG